MKSPRMTLAKACRVEDLSHGAELRSRIETRKAKFPLDVAVPWQLLEDKIVENVFNLLDTELSALCLGAWAKYREIQELADPEKHPAGEANEVALLKHEIVSEQHPTVEIIWAGAPVARMELDLEASIELEGCTLEVEDGMITRLTLGTCRCKATLLWEGMPLLEAKSPELKLGDPIELGKGVRIPRPAA